MGNKSDCYYGRRRKKKEEEKEVEVWAVSLARERREHNTLLKKNSLPTETN